MTRYTVKLHGLPSESVSLFFGEYGNGRVAIRLDCAEGPYAKATVNLPDEALDPAEVAIKDYSENEGMLDFLIKNAIVEPPHRFSGSGHVTIPICRLTEVTMQTVTDLRNLASA